MSQIDSILRVNSNWLSIQILTQIKINSQNRVSLTQIFSKYSDSRRQSISFSSASDSIFFKSKWLIFFFQCRVFWVDFALNWRFKWGEELCMPGREEMRSFLRWDECFKVCISAMFGTGTLNDKDATEAYWRAGFFLFCQFLTNFMRKTTFLAQFCGLFLKNHCHFLV